MILGINQAVGKVRRKINKAQSPWGPGEGSEEFYTVQEQAVISSLDSSWMGWSQGEVSSIINLLVSTSLGSVFLWSAGSSFCKNNLGICVRLFLIYIFQETGSLVILIYGRIIV